MENLDYETWIELFQERAAIMIESAPDTPEKETARKAWDDTARNFGPCPAKTLPGGAQEGEKV